MTNQYGLLCIGDSFILPFSVFSTMPERIYQLIAAMGFLALFTFQLDNTMRKTLPAPHCQHPIAIMGVVDTFRLYK